MAGSHSRGAATLRSELRLLEWVPDGVVVTDADGVIVFANRRAARMTRYNLGELVGRPVEVLLPNQLRSIHRRQRTAFSDRGGTRAMGRLDHGFRVRRKDGGEIVVDISLGSIDMAHGGRTIAVMRDITDRRRLESQLEHQALHDPLTGLANRTLFFDRINQSISSARRDGKKVAIAVLDLDRFKAVNDLYGHSAGDQLLKKLALRLGSGLRATDTAARLGGDEFAWILPGVTGRPSVERMARRRMRELQQPFVIDRKEIALGVSAGIAMFPLDGRDADTLIRHADSAMYAAKRDGRGLAFFHSRPQAGAPIT